MSIRARHIHFTDWAKVLEALQDHDINVLTEDEARAFLSDDTNRGNNPFYYYVGYIKSSQEIYTHGMFYSCVSSDGGRVGLEDPSEDFTSEILPESNVLLKGVQSLTQEEQLQVQNNIGIVWQYY